MPDNGERRRVRILFIGDIVGRPGRRIIADKLPLLHERHGGFDCVIANAENAAGGTGLTPKIAQELFRYGITLLTTGNHIWNKRELIPYIDSEPRILRPANTPEDTPGRGGGIFSCGETLIGVLNLAGQVFMSSYDNPFRTATRLLAELKTQTSILVVDMHAEATAEKQALGWYLDSQVSAVIGTHTHVQTADERILPGGTAYISDAGMTGPYDSVIGVKVEPILYRFVNMMPSRNEVAKGNVRLCGVVIDVDPTTGQAFSITRVNEPMSE